MNNANNPLRSLPMKLTVDKITADLPPETLRRVDIYLREAYKTAMAPDGAVPRFTASTDAALGLVEKMGLYYLVGCDPILEYKYVQILQYGSGLGWIGEKYLCVSDLAPAIIRALLKSQNIKTLEV